MAKRGTGPGRRGFLRRLGASVAATLAVPGAASAQARKAAPGRKPKTKAQPKAAPAKAAVARPAPAALPEPAPVPVVRGGWPQPAPGARIDLAPARWIWLPGERTLANTFVLFRREIELATAPVSARGFVSADSRYRLFVNGRRVQWGPAPCDPRSYEADPIDLARWLVPGPNVIGVEVLYYGHGDGTWPFGKPGFLMALRVEEPGGRVSELLSDETWRVFLDRAHRPGQFKRSYLRALQEDFDARLHPVGWSAPGFTPDAAWIAPQLLDAGADRPAAAGTHADYLSDGGIEPTAAALRAREVPLVRETLRPMGRLAGSGRVRWRRDPRDWFEFRIPGSFEIVDEQAATPAGEGAWRLEARAGEGVFATFELPEQMVGFPFLTIEAPEGAVVELLTQEAHDSAGPAWLDSGRFAWTRFVCRAGENRFECFDYESLRFLQVHVHAAEGPVLLCRRGPAPPRLRVARGPELPLVGARAAAALRGLLQHAHERRAGDDRGRHGPRAPAVERRRLAPAAGDAARVRRPPARAPLPAHVRDGPDTRGLLPRLLAGLRPAQPPRAAAGGGEPVGAAPRPRRVVRARRLAALPGVGRQRPADSALPALRAPRGVSARAARQGRPAAGRRLGRAERLDRRRLRAAAPQAVRLQPVHGGGAEGRARAARGARGRRGGGEALRGRGGRARRGDGRPLLERRTFAFREQPAVGGRGGRAAARRPLARDGAALRPVSGRRASLGRSKRSPRPRSALLLSFPASSHWRMQALARHGRIDAVLGELRARWAALPSVLRNNTISERLRRARPTRPTSGATARSLRSSRSTWTSRASGPRRRASRRRRSGRSSANLEELELVCHTPRGAITFRAAAQEEGHRAWVTLARGLPGRAGAAGDGGPRRRAHAGRPRARASSASRCRKARRRSSTCRRCALLEEAQLLRQEDEHGRASDGDRPLRDDAVGREAQHSRRARSRGSSR